MVTINPKSPAHSAPPAPPRLPDSQKVQEDLNHLKNGTPTQQKAYKDYQAAFGEQNKNVSYMEWAAEGLKKAEGSGGTSGGRTTTEWKAALAQANGNLFNDKVAIRHAEAEEFASSSKLRADSAASGLHSRHSDLPDQGIMRTEEKVREDLAHLRNGTPTQQKAYNDYQAVVVDFKKNVSYEQWAAAGLKNAEGSGTSGGRTTAEWKAALAQAKGNITGDERASFKATAKEEASSSVLRDDIAKLRK